MRILTVFLVLVVFLCLASTASAQSINVSAGYPKLEYHEENSFSPTGFEAVGPFELPYTCHVQHIVMSWHDVADPTKGGSCNAGYTMQGGLDYWSAGTDVGVYPHNSPLVLGHTYTITICLIYTDAEGHTQREYAYPGNLLFD